jgi:hypothetical protein
VIIEHKHASGEGDAERIIKAIIQREEGKEK